MAKAKKRARGGRRTNPGTQYAGYHDAPASVKRQVETKIQTLIHEGYDIPQAAAIAYREYGIKPRRGKA